MDKFEAVEWMAKQDYENALGKVVLLRHAVLGDGNSVLEDFDFDPPIAAVITETDYFGVEGNWGRDGDVDLLDSTYNADAMEPGDLPDVLHIAWIQGPTYWVDPEGQVNKEPGSIVQAVGDQEHYLRAKLAEVMNG